MKKYLFVLLAVLVIGCDSTHKLTGTNYVDIQNESPPPIQQDYPQEVIDSVGWNDITSAEKEREDDEELRMWFSSELYPGHLLKIEKGKRSVDGEVIIYWRKDTLMTKDGAISVDARMRHFFERRCNDFQETENYGYCYPSIASEDGINWEEMYGNIEARDFWQIPGQPQEAGQDNDTENNWKMFVQMRLGSFYRHYTHQNPEAYDDGQLRSSLVQLSSAVRQISSQFKLPSDRNVFEGITDGTNFIPCDSTELWEIRADLDRLLSRGGLNMEVSFEEDESYYYLMVKGRIQNIWYHEWASVDYDRRFFPQQVLDIRAVGEIECPEMITGF